MFRYRMLFLSKTTFYAAAIAALVFFPLGTVLTGLSGELTVLRAALPIFCTVLCVGLIAVYRSENLIHLVGMIICIFCLSMGMLISETEGWLKLLFDSNDIDEDTPRAVTGSQHCPHRAFRSAPR